MDNKWILQYMNIVKEVYTEAEAKKLIAKDYKIITGKISDDNSDIKNKPKKEDKV